MAEKDADDNTYSFENANVVDAAKALPEEDGSLNTLLDDRRKKEENESFDFNSFLPSHESPLKKEENPFSFKKFLNQDLSSQKNKGARKKVYTAPSLPATSKLDMPNHSLNKSHVDMKSRMVNASDVSSVLPDFVQDHLVIEQCYLSGSSPAIDIDNLNLQNLPDLNLEHRNVHFAINSDRDKSTQNSDHFSTNLPDFTLGVRNIQSMTTNSCNNKTLPDFTLNARSDGNDDVNNIYKDQMSSRILDASNGNDTSHSTRQRAQISSSPSVPFDLPSYENNESIKKLPIPFDLTVPAEENSNNTRGMASTETVSKSLPDFLSDGPIKKQLDENLHNVRGNVNLIQNGLPSPEISSVRSEQGRWLREIDYLRRQLIEKNRRLEMLETELEHLHNTDQRETASLEYALQEVENNLKRTAKRAILAEDMVLKLKHENKLLKSEICTLRSENVELRLGNNESPATPSQEIKNQKIAKELRTSANVAENFLRSLLMGVDNLRALAASIDNSEKFHDGEDQKDFSHADSASGSAL